MAYMQQKINQQVNRPTGPKAHPKHLAALAAAKMRPRVRVEPTNEEQRHVLRHPNAPAFRDTGSIEWPFDRFTQRRLREGSIRIVEEIVAGRREKLADKNAERQPERQTERQPERQPDSPRTPEAKPV
jgi:hypothetical protein